MPRITEDQVREKVIKNSLSTCEYVSGYINAQSLIQVKCIKHDLVFSTKYENVKRDNRPHHICPACKEDKANTNKIELLCDFCGKRFFRSPSELSQKSGFNFCCREHKDLAQRIDSGIEFADLRPSHYNPEESKNYRKKAFSNYPHLCLNCGWSEDEDILEVHHIDENRENNKIDNLMILCPTCHRKLTLKKYILKNNKIVLKT